MKLWSLSTNTSTAYFHTVQIQKKIMAQMNENMAIKFDFLTVTSPKPSLRTFFFFLIKYLPFRFSVEPTLRFLGGAGAPYKGFLFKKNPGGRCSEGFFVGQRRSRFGYDYIVMMPGEICNLFVLHFLSNYNLRSGVWRMTRIDLELTLNYGFESRGQIMFLYWNFYLAQKIFEKTKKRSAKFVKFVANDDYLLLSVGRKSRNPNEWKVYSSKFDGAFPRNVDVRFEVTIKNSSKYLKTLSENGECVDKCNFKVIQGALRDAANTRILEKHRHKVKDWSTYTTAEEGPLGKNRFRDHRPPTEEPSRRPIDGCRRKRQSRFSQEFGLVAQALQSFAEMVKLKQSVFSHKQISALNSHFPFRNWRLSWNRREQWAIVPRKGNPLWGPLMAPLPKKALARRRAVDDRREALRSLSSKINTIVRDCGALPTRKRKYLQEPKANRLIRQIFEVVQKYPVMDKSVERLPRAKVVYSDNFDDKPYYVQEIIRKRARAKYEKKETEKIGYF